MLLPPPQLEPLKRLCVSDGLLLNAELWHHAHHYHQHRQNVHFQSLYEPGIVYGLGVVLSDAPEQTPSQYRDQRWVEIQPGLAIDLEGNPIVVDEPVAFPVAPIETDHPLTIYLTIRHVDPETLERPKEQCVFQERFRIDQVNREPTGREVELCRIHLHPGAVSLGPTPDPFHPSVAQLDRRYRPIIRPRPQCMVHLAQGILDTENEADTVAHHALRSLARSLSALYPSLRTHPTITSISLTSDAASTPIASDDCSFRSAEDMLTSAPHLLYLPFSHIEHMNDEAIATLKSHIQQGGTLLIELLEYDAQWRELNAVRQEIEESIATTNQQRGLTTIRFNLQSELEACNQTLEEQTQDILDEVNSLAQRLDLSSGGQDIQTLAQNHPLDDHPLLQEPFLFGQLPMLNSTCVQVFAWEGIILVLGNLSQGWGGQAATHQLSRDTIRAAQELGVNLLHFAWKRKTLMGA